jgi:hypothetical protein
MPPGDLSSSASSQQFDINVMAVMAAPVMAFVLIYIGYALVVWRHREGDDEDGPQGGGSAESGAEVAGAEAAAMAATEPDPSAGAGGPADQAGAGGPGGEAGPGDPEAGRPADGTAPAEGTEASE